MRKLEIIKNKIKSVDLLLDDITQWRKNGLKLVFSNGCFDILHKGHIEYLSKASDLGDKFIIGLNTDLSVRNIKGDTRPIQDETSRAIILASLMFVDAVVLFDEDTPYELIKKISPDILVKGKDYAIEEVVGYDIVTQNGGRVETIELTDGYSTSSVINKILNH